MLTLKDKINRILGNNVRLLLPSYWWKRVFGLISDEVEGLETDVKSLTKHLSSISGKITNIPNVNIIQESIFSNESNAKIFKNVVIGAHQLYYYREGNTITSLLVCEEKVTIDSLLAIRFKITQPYSAFSSYVGYSHVYLFEDGHIREDADWHRITTGMMSHSDNIPTEGAILNLFTQSPTSSSFRDYDSTIRFLQYIVSNSYPQHDKFSMYCSFPFLNGTSYYYSVNMEDVKTISINWRDNYGGVWESTITEETNIWVHKTNYGGTIIFGETLDEESKTKNLEFLKDNSPNIGTFLKNIEDGSMYRLLSYKQSASSTDIWDLYISRNGITEHWTVNTTDGTTSFVGDIGVTKEELNEAVTTVLNTEV